MPRPTVAVLTLALALAGAPRPASADEPIDAELAELDVALAARPADVSLLVSRAEHLILAERADLALADMALAAALAPHDERVPAVRAEALAALGRPDAALTEVERAIAAGHPSTRVLQLRARLLASLARTDEAIVAWDEALARRPDPDGFLERSALLVSRGRHDEALDGLHEGLTLTQAASLRVEVVETARRLGRWDEALAALEPLVREDTGPRWRIVRGELLALAGRMAEAHRDFEVALTLLAPRLERRPTAASHLDHARALAGLGRMGEAEAAVRRALSRSPGYRPAVAELARIRAAMRTEVSTGTGGAR